MVLLSDIWLLFRVAFGCSSECHLVALQSYIWLLYDYDVKFEFEIRGFNLNPQEGQRYESQTSHPQKGGEV